MTRKLRILFLGMLAVATSACAMSQSSEPSAREMKEPTAATASPVKAVESPVKATTADPGTMGATTPGAAPTAAAGTLATSAAATVATAATCVTPEGSTAKAPPTCAAGCTFNAKTAKCEAAGVDNGVIIDQRRQR